MIVSKKSFCDVLLGGAQRKDTAAALKVMPRSCSSGRSSMSRSVPASRGGIAPPAMPMPTTAHMRGVKGAVARERGDLLASTRRLYSDRSDGAAPLAHEEALRSEMLEGALLRIRLLLRRYRR